jgi:uncharacterized membrane protein YdjX (TVP38/TMEM64 family)
MTEDPYRSSDSQITPAGNIDRLERIHSRTRNIFWLSFIIGLLLGIFLPLLGYYIPQDDAAENDRKRELLQVAIKTANLIFCLCIPAGIVFIGTSIALRRKAKKPKPS